MDKSVVLPTWMTIQVVPHKLHAERAPHVISIEDARRIAEEFLDESVRGHFDFEVVVVDESIKDAGNFWILPYNGRAYVNLNDFREAMAGNVPIVVDKETGRASFKDGVFP